MKVTCTHENISRALQMVGRVVGNRTTLPVLGNVLVQTNEGRLVIAATDLEIGLTTTIGAKVEEEGAITIPARTLVEFVGSVSDTTVHLQTEAQTLHIRSERAKATLRGIDADEFPVIPTITSSDQITVHAAEFLQGLKQVVIAVASDDSRPVLAGVLLRWSERKLVCVATDSYRLAERTLSLEQSVKEAKEAIIPARAINELTRIIGLGGSDQLDMLLQDNQVLFRFGDTQFVSRLIEGKYPDYEKIIPGKLTTQARIQSDDLKSTLRSAGIFARESANTAKFHFGPGNTIVLRAVADQLGDAEVNLPAEIEGEEADSSFNIKYVADAAGVITDTTIQIGLSGKYQPCLIKGDATPQYRYVVMPLRTD